MQYRGGEPGRRREADAKGKVADLCDAGIRQHPFEILLEDGDRRGRQHGDRAQDREADGERHGAKRKLYAEDRKHKPQKHINCHLGCGRGEKRADRGRGIRIGIRQPQVQREESDLEPEADRQEGKTGSCGSGARNVGQPLGKILHIERAGQRV